MIIPQNKLQVNQPRVSGRRVSMNLKLGLLLGLLSLAVYANTLKNGYVLDDTVMINENSYVKEGFKGIPELLVTPHLKGYTPNMTDTYRQLSLIMFAIEYQLFGPNPFTGHLFNILVFAGCVMILFYFLNKLFDGQRVALAFMASLLFVLHPIHTEVVANIKSRDELLCFFFAFLSLNIFINYARQGRLSQLLSGAFCLFLSIISKETVFTFIGVIPLIFFFYINENRRRSVYITTATVVVVVVFITIRAIVINHYKADGMIRFNFIDNALTGAPSAASRIATAILILGHYLKLLIIPYPLICDYSYNSIPFVGFGNIWVWVSLSVYIGFGSLGFYRLYKYKKDPWAFGILYYLFTLSLFTNIPFIVGAMQADRLIFFASAGICLLIALVIEKYVLRSQELTLLKSTKALALLAICIVFAAITINRNADWLSNYKLFSTDVIKSPDNCRLNNFVALELYNHIAVEEQDLLRQKQIINEANAYSKKAIAIYSGYAEAMSNLALSYNKLKEYDSSILYCYKTLAIEPNNIEVLKGMGNNFLNKQNYDSAEAYYKKVVIFKTNDAAAINDLGSVYGYAGKLPQAIEQFKKAIANDPNFSQAYSNLGYCYFDMQQYKPAIENFKIGISLDSKNEKDISYIAKAWQNLGEMDSAKKYEAIVQKNDPNFKL